MGAIGGILGLGGGAAGTGFGGPQAANQLQGVTAGQANQATSNAYAQQQLLQALQGQVNTQVPGAIAAQQGLSQQLQGLAAGTGPNPAMAQLNQTTGQNVANQASLQAGQRGAGANVGLLARQAGQQGGALQQQAVGQGATMEAQQQLAAMQALQGLSGQQLSQAQGGSQATNQAAQGYQQNLLGATNTQNANNIAAQSNLNNVNAGLAGGEMQGTQGLIGGAMNALGAGSSLAGGKKAEVGMLSQGGVAGPQSALGQYLAGMCNGGQMKQGGMVDVVVSPGEKIALPQEVQKLAQGGKPQLKTVPGKAEVKGDSLKNDKVPAKLPAGTVVVKRTRANNNPEGFIKEVLSKRKGGK